VKAGVLALQGAFREHREALNALDVEVVEVRRPEHLAGVDALVLPGGESTTMDKLLDSSDLREPIAERLTDGLPALATCAGLIVLAREVTDGRPDQRPLQVLDLSVRRNGYGRQRESFEVPLSVDGLAGGPFPGVFIRAPVVERVGASVAVLSEHDGKPVLGRQGSVWWATFHPELAGDLRIHRSFVNEI
jgi:pyridoxal 5'-phosphate synthase pdxT subunit